MASQMSKKRKFMADGVFFAELNEVLTRELAEDGYSGVEVRVTPMWTEILIRATRTQNILGEKGRRIRELISVVQKRFKFPLNNVELYAEKVNNQGLYAIAQAESLHYKLLEDRAKPMPFKITRIILGWPNTSICSQIQYNSSILPNLVFIYRHCNMTHLNALL
ncbi:hypothetical protein UlMin_023614 [Ulmus minor]